MSKTPNTVAFDAPERSMNGDGDNSSYPLIAAVVVQDQATCSEEQTGSSQLVLNASDYLVSEHEDNDGVGTINKVDDDREELDRRISSKSRGQIIAACDHGAGNILTEDGNGSGPAEIPPETDDVEKSDVNDAKDEDEESDYSYDYEDDEDGQYSGFLMSTEPTYDTIQSGVTSVVPQEEKKHVVEDDEGKSSFEQITQFAPLKRTLDPVLDDKKSKWKEPTQEAVSMSLRAEREKSGGRRRLAADLYKVMITDTKEAGFIVEQKGDECMDKWAVKLFKFDEDSDLHKDLLVLGLDHVELEMNFPEQYPFEPPFVRVVRPRFKRQTGFVMNGALCMELLTNEGWNPINDIESVIVSIRSLLVVGDGRLEAATNMPEKKREALLAEAIRDKEHATIEKKTCAKRKRIDEDSNKSNKKQLNIGTYSTAEATAAYAHLSSYHKKKGWSGWWAKRG